MQPEEKIALAYPNYVDDYTLSGGSWTTSLPLTNLQNRVFSRVARTTDALEASTQFSGVYDPYRPLGAIALANHNMSSAANIRVVFYADTAKTTTIYDSGVIPVWGAVFNSIDLEWEDNNYWEGTPDQEDLENLNTLFVLFTPTINIAAAFDVFIYDESNPDGYVEIGRLLVSDVWQPEINAKRGISFTHDINTEIESSLSNTEYFDVRTPRRVVNFELDGLSVNEAFARLFRLQRNQGIDQEIIFAYNMLLTPEYYDRTFVGRLAQPDPITQPYIDRFESSVNLIEIV